MAISFAFFQWIDTETLADCEARFYERSVFALDEQKFSCYVAFRNLEIISFHD